jgi:hypothetical protein
MRTLVTRTFHFESARQIWKTLETAHRLPWMLEPAPQLPCTLEAAGLAVDRIRLWETADSCVEVPA